MQTQCQEIAVVVVAFVEHFIIFVFIVIFRDICRKAVWFITDKKSRLYHDLIDSSSSLLIVKSGLDYVAFEKKIKVDFLLDYYNAF